MIRKYRVWVKSENRMITDAQEFIPLIVTNKGVMKLQPQYEENYYEILPNDWFEFMEFTGLYDDKGKEIYESDICEIVYDGEVYTYIVVWDQEECDFKATNGEENYGRNFMYLGGNDEITVIGNIYDNPELLKNISVQ